MGKTLHRLYLRFRQPKIFLIALCTFIGAMLLLHFFFGVDGDWGGTNLTLSSEASIASAVITVAAEETLRLLRLIWEEVKAIREGAKKQDIILATLLAMAEAERERDNEQLALMRSMKETDERLLKTLTGEKNGMA